MPYSQICNYQICFRSRASQFQGYIQLPCDVAIRYLTEVQENLLNYSKYQPLRTS